MIPQLLDTHIFLWYAWGDKNLSVSIRAAIEAPEAENWVSIASVWEMTIKISLGKMQIAKPLPQFLEEHLDGNGFRLLNINRSHLFTLADLPPHHRDPFDRLLIAQSLSEKMPLISADAIFDTYPITRIG